MDSKPPINSYATMWFVFGLILTGLYSVFSILIGWTAHIWWTWEFDIGFNVLRLLILTPLLVVFLGSLKTYNNIRRSGERGKFLALISMIIPVAIIIYIVSIIYAAYTCTGPCT